MKMLSGECSEKDDDDDNAAGKVFQVFSLLQIFIAFVSIPYTTGSVCYNEGKEV